MKFTKAVISAVLSGLMLLSGCSAKTYGVYTNIAEGFTVALKNYKRAEGLAATQTMGEPERAGSGNYKSVGKTFYGVMTADATVVVTDDFTDAETAENKFVRFTEEAEKLLTQINASLSVGEEQSSVSRFNGAAAGETVEIDAVAYEVLETALEMYEFTQGYYNPAIYYGAEMYGFYDWTKRPETSEELPSDAQVEAFRELSSHFGEVKLFEEDGRYYAVKPGAVCVWNGAEYSMKIDLGGIGKGYSADKISALMDEYGYKFGYFDFGSSSMICKNHYKNGNYTVGFRDPRSADGRAYFEVGVNNRAVSTSADDVKYYTLDNVRYCHIFNPVSGRPVTGEIMSASVIGASAVRGDALTTAIMAMGRQRAVQFVNEKITDEMIVFCCDEG